MVQMSFFTYISVMKYIVATLILFLSSFLYGYSEIEKTINSISDSNIVKDWINESMEATAIDEKLDLLKKAIEVSIEMNYYQGRYRAYLAKTIFVVCSASSARN